MPGLELSPTRIPKPNTLKHSPKLKAFSKLSGRNLKWKRRLRTHPMIVFVNGKFVSEEDAVISVFDRGFLYGDGLFEALRISNGKPFRWEQHWQRLEGGAEVLKLKLPYAPSQLRAFADE